MVNEKISVMPSISKIVDDGKMYFAKCEQNGTCKNIQVEEADKKYICEKSHVIVEDEKNQNEK